MFEHFTTNAIKTIILAQEESRRLGHNFVGTEQLLLGVAGVAEGHSKEILRAHNISLKDLRAAVKKIIGLGNGSVADEFPFTPRAKLALESAWTAAKEQSVNYGSIDHLFLGILNQHPTSTSGQALRQLKVDPIVLRDEISAVLIRGESASLSTASGILDPAKLKAVTASLAQAALYLRILSHHIDERLNDESDTAAAVAWLNANHLVSELEAFNSDIDRLVPGIQKSIEQIKDRLRSQD